MAGPPNLEDPPGRTSRRKVVLSIGAVVVLAVVATIVVVTTRSGTPTGGSSGGTGGSGGSTPASGSAGADTSAAKLLGWGQPSRSDEFDGPRGPEWRIYDGDGHDGNGRRSPKAIGVKDGILTITGDSKGTTGGLAWIPGQKYGRWEGRVKTPAADPSYHALLLLWPDAEDWPVGGEVDFMETTDPGRQSSNFFLHYGEDNQQEKGEVSVDATQWHNWAVEWTPDHIITYLDGKEWHRTTDTSKLPPRAMHLTIQLDWFPEDGSSTVKESNMQVDWVKEYPLSQ